MILSSLLLLSASFALPAQEGTPDDRVLRLRNGRILVCEVLQHDFDGLEVRDLHTDGRYVLSWDALAPGDAERLKSGFGYQIEQVEVLVPASRLLLVNGQVLVGRILRRDTENIELRVRRSTSMIPTTRLAAPPEDVRVPASEILTPEQFYAERAPEYDLEQPLDNLRFAVELEQVFALDQAQERLEVAAQQAAERGDQALIAKIAGVRSALEITLAHRAQAQALEDIRQAMHRERFAAAKERLDAFGEDYPDSPLKGEYQQLLDRFETQRRTAMERYLVRNWFDAVVSILKKKALDKDAQVDQLMEWTTNEAPQQVRARMLAGLKGYQADLDPSELDSLWAGRLERGAKRHQASYGNGTWILGEDRARAGLEEEREQVDDGKTPEQRELEERTKRYLENLERARRKSSGTDEDTPEDWWRQASANRRFQFLLADYAEFSGDYEVTNVSFSPCPTCAGQGYLTSVSLGPQGGREVKTKCPTCHGVQVQRSVTFR